MSDPPTMSPPPQTLTIIVAATAQKMGIGLHGKLPWQGLLKAEMAYFRKVTSQVPPNIPPSTPPTTEIANAVIMGRRTWDSIPEKFRPLRGRVNVVLSHSAATTSMDLGLVGKWGPYVLPSIPAALDFLPRGVEPGHGEKGRIGIGNIFVIGGAEVYESALRLPDTKRILWTRIGKEMECDTFFPVDLSKPEEGGWVEKEREKVELWVGSEALPEGVQWEADVEWEVVGFERVCELRERR